MPNRYSINIYDTNGALVAALDDWRNLNYIRKLNAPDEHTLSLNGLSPNVSAMDHLDYIVEVRRWGTNLSKYTDYTGFHRTSQYQFTSEDNNIFTSYGRGLNDLLRRRFVLYKTGTAGAAKSGAGETIAKQYVSENAGPSALITNGRIFDGVTRNLTIELDNGLGDICHGDRAYQNLLDVLQEISVHCGIDFNMVLTSLSPLSFEFRTYSPYYGRDRSVSQTALPPVIFSLDRGNIVGPSFTISRTEEATVLIVVGQGQQSNRANLIDSSSDMLDSPWNQIEVVKDARQENQITGLAEVADQELQQLLKKESLVFDVLQQDTSRYGIDYDLGDLVTVEFAGVVRDLQITQVSVNIGGDDQTEKIQLTFGQNHIAPKNNPLTEVTRRLRHVEVSERSEQAGAVEPIAFVDLPTPDSTSLGRTRFCTDCLKVGEAAGLGTGTVVYDDGSNWIRVGDDTVAGN